MDELVAFLVEELAMDGESGTDKDRFIGFIKSFHQSRRSTESTSSVSIDDDYIDYVWSLVLQHPTVHVGVRLPPVKKIEDSQAFAPKGGKKKRDGAKEMSSKIDTVRLLPKPEGPHSFKDLYKREHGDEVRIVLDEDFVRLKLTGTAIKDFLVPNYYATLQLIARAREKALPSSEICRILGYPPTTVFSFLKALIDLDLITKFQAHETGTTGNLLLHRRYRGLNETYLAQQMAARETAELGRTGLSGAANDGEADSDDEGGQGSTRRGALADVPSERTIDIDEQESVADLDEDEEDSQAREGPAAPHVVNVTSAFHGMLAFPTMSRQRALAYLSSTALIRARILTLLLASTNHIVTKARLWDRLGFPATWNRSERKSFLEAVRKLIATGLVEPVRVDVGNGKLLACHRLTEAGAEEAQRGGQNSQDGAARREQQELELLAEKSTFAYQAHVPYERQVLESVKRTGADGVTTNQIRDVLHFSRGAKRHLDEYLSARVNDAEDGTPDFSIHMGQENVNRERRNRWRCRLGLVQKHQELQQANDHSLRKVVEQLGPLRASALDGFTSPPEELTWHSINQLNRVLKAGVVPTPSRVQNTQASLHTASPATKGRKSHTNPIDPSTGTPKRGRPRKEQATPGSKKRKAHDGLGSEPQASDAALMPPPPKRGRADEGSEQAGATAESAALDARQTPDDGDLAATESAIQSATEHANGEALRLSCKHPLEDNAAQADSPVAASGRARAASTLSSGESPVSTPLAKRVKTTSTPKPRKTVTVGPRVNFSMEKRMATFVELLDANDGVIDDMTIAKKYEAFVADKFSGRPKEAEAFAKEVDFRDTKGRARLYSALEARGDIKTTTTMVAMKKGAASSKRRIVYKADLDPAVLQKFVQDVMEGRAGYRSSRGAAMGTAAGSLLSGRNIGQVAIDSAEMVANKPEAILSQRPTVELLADPNTRVFFAELAVVRSQPYGLIPGEMARLKHLHQDIMARLETGEDGNEGVVSADKGIFDVDWFIHNCPLELYCKVKPIGRELPELLEALSDPARCKLPMGDQTLSIRTTLDHQNQVRTRTWFDKYYFHRLSLLGLAVPVEQGAGGDYLDAAPNASTSLLRFKQATWMGGILRISEQLQEPLNTATDADKVWAELAANKESYGRQIGRAKRSSTASAHFSPDSLRSLAIQMENRRGWFSNFQLVQRQSRFLQRFLAERKDRFDVESILQDRAALQTVSDVIIAPLWVIEAYIERHGGPKAASGKPRRHATVSTADGALDGDVQHQEGRSAGTASTVGRKPRGQKPRPSPPMPSLAALSPEEAALEGQRRSRQEDWEDAFDDICHVYSIAGEKRAKLDDALYTIRALYVEGSAPLTLQMIRTMVAAAVRDKPDQKVASTPSKGTRSARAEAKRSGEAVISGRRRKRPDVTWTRKTDELLRDACVILTARDCFRGTHRSNWSALQQIFPDVNPVTLRARFTRLASAVGEEAYLMQLEKEWTRLWEAFRGTVILPDDDFRKPDAFDLATHIEFLRMHVDKDEVLDTVERSAAVVGLPASVEDLGGEWVLRDPTPVQAHLDVVHDPETSLAIAARKEALMSRSIFLHHAEPSGTARDDDDGGGGGDVGLERAQAAVKMCIETPSELWNEETAVAFCESVGPAHVEEACQTLLDAKVIRNALPEGRRLPGRNFVYSEDFLRSSSSTSLKVDRLCREAALAHKKLAEKILDGQTEVDVGANNSVGETMILAEQLCAAEAQPKVEMTQLHRLRDKQMFNAKTIIDQDVEVFLTIEPRIDADSGVEVGAGPLDASVNSLSRACEGAEGTASEAAWQAAGNLIASALGKADRSREEVRGLLHSFRSALEQAGAVGLCVPDIEGVLASHAIKAHQLPTTSMLCMYLTGAAEVKGKGTKPCAFIAGYDGPRLISSIYSTEWAVRVFPAQEANTSPTWASPRAWKSLTGEYSSSRFHTGLQQLLSQVLVRTGTTRARLCEVMRRPSLGGWDRLEVCDLLVALGSKGSGAHTLPSIEFRTMQVKDGRLQEVRVGCQDVDWWLCSDDDIYVVPAAGGQHRSWWRVLEASQG